MSDKYDKYLELVAARKMCDLCNGLVNPSRCAGGKYDSDEIGPWSLWQGNLDAELMVVGQDWGDIKYFIEHRGRDDDPNNPTNWLVRELLAEAGFAIEKAGQTTGRGTMFLTNAILCLKSGNLSAEEAQLTTEEELKAILRQTRGGLGAPVKESWFNKCGPRFLRPEVELIHPCALVTLGKRAYSAVCKAFGFWPADFKAAVETEASNKPEVLEGVRLFPVYHPSPQVIRTGTRTLEQQQADWRRIGEYLGRAAGGSTRAS
jgi:uracil-DNA glycosylase